jgi:hypothetical protein
MFQVEYTSSNGDYSFKAFASLQQAEQFADAVELGGGEVLALTKLSASQPTADEVTMNGRYSCD